jgi:uncharacterized membrane protein
MSEAPANRHDRRYGLRTGRLEAFSDGVFAIAITLLVLKIGIPDRSEERLLTAMAEQWPSYLAYLISFATIGAVWLKHAVTTEFLDHTNGLLLRLNLLLLLVVAFLLFPTRLVAEYVGQDEPGRITTTTFYGLVLFLASLLLSVLWRYAVHAGLLRPETPAGAVQSLPTWLTPGLAGYLIMLLLGLFLPLAAVFGYLAVALYLVVPFELRRHVLRHPRPGESG